MQRHIVIAAFLLLATAAVPTIHAQNQPMSATAPTLTADYPLDRAGIFIKDTEWSPVANQSPVKTKAAYARTRSDGGQPVLCICHMISLPGDPVLVRLHPKKDSRELDGGKMIVYPVVGGAKSADANKSDLIPVDVSHPEENVWLVRPQEALSPGEYALMLGTQNMSIFAFTVAK
jgi:hypothetical protein